ncbi:MAG: CaiB/BaiF CoA-transferase family protein [Pseudomonadota bacterium]
MSGPRGPLQGVRVLDLTRILAGPTCTQLLGDFGADVIKIERPGGGDDTRAWGPPFVTAANGEDTTESAYYLASNRNKRSVTADIATPEGQSLIRKLLVHCDIIVENFKVGGLAKYGLSYADLKDEFPGVVYCSVTGFGQTGPNAHRAGYDLLAQGAGGIMSLTGDAEGAPMKVGVGIADVMCGMYAASAILAALHHRNATGEGQHIDVALLDTQMAWLVNEGTNYLTSGKAPLRRGNEHPNIVPYGVFAVADGHAIIAVGNDAQFARFCRIIGHPDLAEDERFARNQGRLENRHDLLAALNPILSGIERDVLLAGMESEGVPGGPIHTVPEAFTSPQSEAREMVVNLPHPLAGPSGVRLIGNPVKFSGTPVTYRRAPPTCGADTDDVLQEFGL